MSGGLPLYAITLLPDLTLWVKSRLDSLGVAWLSDAAAFLMRINLLHVVVLGVAAVLLLLLRRWIGPGKADVSASLLPDVSREMRSHADQVAALLGVRYVTCGHTHYADVASMRGGGMYFNTGSWIPVYEEKEQLYRDMRQCTFLRIDASGADLLRWNQDARCPEPVVVMDTETPALEPEETLLRLLLAAFRNR